MIAKALFTINTVLTDNGKEFTDRFDSAASLKATLRRFVYLYDYHIPQKNLHHKTPLRTLQQWSAQQPRLFKKILVIIRDLTYKKPRLIPGKVDREAQERFLEAYDDIKKNKGKDDPIYFMDATHPQHNPVLAGGWIKRGEEQEIPTNTSRIKSHDKLDRLFAAL